MSGPDELLARVDAAIATLERQPEYTFYLTLFRDCRTRIAANAALAADNTKMREREEDALRALLKIRRALGLDIHSHDDLEVVAAALAARCEELEQMLIWLDNNSTFYDVDADYPVEGENIPTLAQVSERIWYHATDDVRNGPLTEVIRRALASQAEGER